jgi:hypothetical protein
VNTAMVGYLPRSQTFTVSGDFASVRLDLSDDPIWVNQRLPLSDGFGSGTVDKEGTSTIIWVVASITRRSTGRSSTFDRLGP